MAIHADVARRLQRYGLGENVNLSPTTIVNPKEFQRVLKPRGWEFLVPCIFGEIWVAVIRKGDPYARQPIGMDGQHRLDYIARHQNDPLVVRHNLHVEVPCRLWRDVTFEDAAAIFDLKNSQSVALPPQDEFRAAVVGGDPDAVDLDEELMERGLDGWCQKDRDGKNLGPISSVRRLQRDLGLEHVCYTLDVIDDIWPWEEFSASPHVRIVRGFGQFLRPLKWLNYVPKRGNNYRRIKHRWNPADRQVLVDYLRYKHGDDDSAMRDFLQLAEARVPGGGGGGGSLGMELVLREKLIAARKRARAAAA